jgi:uncharacterized protein
LNHGFALRGLVPWGLMLCLWAASTCATANGHIASATVTGDATVYEIRIPMPDGIELFGCLWRPSDSGVSRPVPVLFKFDPYAGVCTAREPFESYVKAGYAVAYAHVRGPGGSEGVLPPREYSEQELDDAVQVIDWLSRQPWSTGRVGMFGESWSGFNALQVAMRHPPALKAIVAEVATENLYHEDARFADGMLVLSDWTITADIGLIDHTDPSSLFSAATIRDRFEQPPWSLLYLRHQRDGDFWHHRQRLDVQPELIQVPTMMIGGWYDGYRSAVLRAFRKMTAPFKAIVGPWNHGMAFPSPQANLIAATIRWWDYWLKDIDQGISSEPAFHVYMRRPHTPGPGIGVIPGEWRGVEAWPPPGSRDWTLHLTSGRQLSEAPGNSAVHHLRYVPTAGVQAGIWWGDPMPDQRPADAFSLVYESAPLTHELHMLGDPRVTLRVASSAPLANWMVRLSDVAPDGTVTLITGAGRNGAHRVSSENPAPLAPGEFVLLDVPLHFSSWVFEPGHQMRVAVSNALWPMFWPTPHSMTTSLVVGGEQGSRIALPVIPRQSREAADEAAAAVGSVNVSDREAGLIASVPPGPGWIGPARIERDELEGTTTVTYGVGTESDIAVEYQAWDDDPARARYLGTLRVGWPGNDGVVGVYGETEITSDATTFHYRHTRRLLHDGRVVHEKSWQDSIPRDHQ